MDAKLVGPLGPIQLGQSNTVMGRTQDNQIIVNDAKASSHHAELRFTGQDYTIADLGSTNGTYLNGLRLDRMPQVLHTGDTIRIGDTTYTFEQSNSQMPGAGIYGGSSNPNFPPTQLAQPSYPDTAYGNNQGMQNFQPAPFAADPQQQPGFQPYANQQNNFIPPQPQGGSSFNQYNQPPIVPYPPQQQGQNVPFYGQQPTPAPYSSNPPILPYQGGPQYGGGIPPMQQTPPKRSGGGRTIAIVLIVLAFLVIVGGIAAYFGIRSLHSSTTITATATKITTGTGVVLPTVTLPATVTLPVNPTGTPNDTVLDGSYATGTVALSDPMKDNSQGNKWDVSDNCSFSQNVYDTKESSQNTFLTCFAENTNFSNFSYRVLTTIVSGDCSGIAFRGDPSTDKQYFFKVCQDGSYALEISDGTSGKYLLQPTNSSAIRQGLGRINDLAISANNDTIQLFANGTLLNTTQDSTYSSGSIGVVVINETSSATDVIFAGAKVWKI